MTRKNSDALFIDWLALLGDMPSRPGLLSVARSPRIFGTSEAGFALQTAVTLLRAKNLKTFEISGKNAVHGFLSNQEIVGWGVREIVTLMIGNLHAANFEPPSPNNLDSRCAAMAVLVELCLNTPWPKLPTSLATDLIVAIDQNLNPYSATASSQLPLLQALALVIPTADISAISDSLVQKFLSIPVPSPAVLDALYPLLRGLAKNGMSAKSGSFLPLVLKGLEPGAILISAVKCASALAEAAASDTAGVLLDRMLEISGVVEDGPLKAEIVEAAGSCFAKLTQEISDDKMRRLTVLLEQAIKSPATKLRTAAGRAVGETVVRKLAMIDNEVSDLMTIWKSAFEDGSVDVVSATLRSLMLLVSSSGPGEVNRKFLIDHFRGQVRQLARQVEDESSAMRRERLRADAVRALGLFGNLEFSDKQLVKEALVSKVAPTVQSAVWTIEKQPVGFADDLEIVRVLSEISRKVKDEPNARRVLLCMRALLNIREDQMISNEAELLTRKFPGASSKNS
jgi:hypothetical protein